MSEKSDIYYSIMAFAGKSLIKAIEGLINLSIKTPPVFNPAEFEWVAGMEKNCPLIKAEYLAVYNQQLTYDINEISVEQKKVVDDTKWKFFPLYIYGNAIENNIALCPETDRLLKSIPNVTTAFFSILSPGTFIKEHRGAYKGYLRFHLGVDIPQDAQACGIRILENTYHWQNGKSFIFDDTFLHEAWNNSTGKRTVLYVDFIRPMPKYLVGISKLLTRLISASPYVQNGLKNLREKKSAKEVAHILG